MAGINIPFLSNVRDFLKGTGDVEGALDDVADSLDDMAGEAEDAARQSARSLGDVSDALDDVARDSRDTGDDLGTSLDGAAREAEDAAARLERSFRDSLDAVRTESADAGSAVGRDMDEGTREASEGLSQMGEEGAANAREVAASFDGSASSIADGFQGLAAEALGGFGPLGAAAGVAIAAGMGLAMASIEKAKEEAQETAEAIAEIAAEMIDLGTADRGPEQVQEALAAAASEAEDGTIKMQEWADSAKDAGIEFADYAAAMAGDSAAAGRSLDEITQKLDAERAAQRTLSEEISAIGSARGDEGRVKSAQIAEHQKLIDKLDDERRNILDATGVVDEASEVYDLYTEAVDGSSAATIAATEAAEASAEAAAEQAEAIRDSANAAIEASDAQIAYMESLSSTTETIAENGATLDLNTEKGRANQSALNGLAGDILALADANKTNGAATADSNAKLVEGRTAFINAATAAGSTTEAANALADAYGLVPETVTTAASVTGADKVKTDLDALAAPRSVEITPTGIASVWQTKIDSLMAQVRPPQVTVAPRAGMQAK